MSWLSMMIGGAMGFGTQILSNGIRKVPYSREPYWHVTFFFVGCYLGQLYPKAEKALLMDVNELRANKGLPPIVGTYRYFTYEEPSIATTEE